MIRYVPFLKAKRGELNAMGELTPEVRQAICPFFDFPRKKEDYAAESFATTARRIATSLKKHWGSGSEFYFDDFDISQSLNLDGEHQYAYVLRSLQDLQVIPVVALDRSEHNATVGQMKRNGEIASATVAFRVIQEYFEDFEGNEDQIDSDLADVFKEFDAVDLILDCRFCSPDMDVTTTASEITTFAKKFCNTYANVRRVIVTGSSIPASLGDVVKSTTTKVLARCELAIIAKARDLTDTVLVAGDYATVSPFYSDADFDPTLFQKVTSPRLIYSFGRSHYITRGASLASGGQGQYVGLTGTLCGQDFFRPGYSSGESYFYEKSQRVGKYATNGTVVKPCVVAHITYMALAVKV